MNGRKRPRSREPIPAIDIGKLTAGVPRGNWVAISADHERCVAHARDLDEVFEKAEAAGEKEPLVTRVPETDAMLIV